MNSEHPPRLQITNPSIAAYLSLYNIPFDYERFGDLIVFSVPESFRAQANELISNFHHNAKVPVVDFIGALQTVKKQLYAKRAVR